jgi:plastocyanin
MFHRLHWRAFVPMLVVALAVGGGTAVAKKSSSGPKKATLTMRTSLTIKKNKYFKDASSFSPGTIVIRSGGTLTLNNKSGAPHTFSIVKQSDLPRSTNQLLGCGSPGTICETIFGGHQPDADGNPTKPVVDVGAAGIDQPGDSIALNPKSSQKVTVSAAKGKTLYFMCGYHAWMQGRLKTR